MLYRYPSGTVAIADSNYDRPYDDPIAVQAGSSITPDFERSKTTDIIGWVWCTAADGRAGWVPTGWIDRRDGRWRMRRDFNAIELTVRKGDRVAVELGESGFVWGRTEDGRSGWIPDGVLVLDSPDRR